MQEEIREVIESMREPAGHCQACLSDKSSDKDFIISCEVCHSSIHYSHYGRELQQTAVKQLENWRCQRCRKVLYNAQRNKVLRIKCSFCPQLRGIMKRIIYRNQTMWLHPQCFTWCYPMIYSKNIKKQQFVSEQPSTPSSCFWVNIVKDAPCTICHSSYGFKLKCMYYSCQKYYHCTCAKSVGFIRNLDTMRFDNSEVYVPPYCEEHLKKRIQDSTEKSQKYLELGLLERASQFLNIKQGYTVQLHLMHKAIEKYEEDKLIRAQLEKVDKQIIQICDQEPYISQHNSSFLDFIQMQEQKID